LNSNLSRQELTDALQQGLDFTPEDLASNDRGQLSDRQKTVLGMWINSGPKELRRGCRAAMLLLPLLFLALLIALFILVAGDTARGLVNGISGFMTNNPAGLIFVIPVLILIVSGLNSARIEARWRGYIRQIQQSTDNAVMVSRKGVVRRRTIPGRYGQATAYIVIKGKWLQVLETRQYEAFRDGVAYQVYYLEIGPLPYWLSARVVDNT